MVPSCIEVSSVMWRYWLGREYSLRVLVRSSIRLWRRRRFWGELRRWLWLGIGFWGEWAAWRDEDEVECVEGFGDEDRVAVGSLPVLNGEGGGVFVVVEPGVCDEGVLVDKLVEVWDPVGDCNGSFRGVYGGSRVVAL